MDLDYSSYFGLDYSVQFRYVFNLDLVVKGHEILSRYYIAMTNLNKVILCLEKIEGKNLEQNPDNLKHFQ